MSSLVLFVGGFGVDLINYCEEFNKKHHKYVFINYYSIQISQSTFVPHSHVIGFPIIDQDSVTITANNELEKQIRKAIECKKSIILYSRLNDIDYTINHINFIKSIGYDVKIIYINMAINQQITNVLNPNPLFLISYTQQYCIDVNNNIINNIEKIKKISSCFKQIDL